VRELNGEGGPWGTLVWPGKDGAGQQSYQITDEDVLWGCRMVVGEGPEEALEVLQTMAQRFAFVGAWASLVELYQKYSQPINPIWRRDGSKCKGRVGAQGCEPHRLERRDRLARADLDWLRQERYPASADGVADALAWFRGEARTSKVRGAVHFAVRSIVLHHVGGNASSPLIVHKGRNWFSAVQGTRHWSVATVSVLPPGGAIPDPQPEPIPDPGLRPEAIRELQRRLAAAGADPGPIDGIWGRKSQAALDHWRALDREIEAAAAAANLDGGV
jgi:hypothetical protein